MHSPFQLLQLFSAGCLGIFAGAMLTEGALNVPYWRSLPPSEFFAWYAANDARLLGYFRPLTILTAVATLATAAVAWGIGDRSRWYSTLSAALVLAAVAMFFVYFHDANESFSQQSVSPQDLPAALATWSAWHGVRTVLGLVALVSALLSLARPD